MKFLFALILLLELSAFSLSFNDAIKVIKKHEQIQIKEIDGQVASERARDQGSWGDPVLKISAKNYPAEDIRDDLTPMTGLEFALSQKIALSNKYGLQRRSFKLKEKSINQEKEYRSQYLIANFWSFLIQKNKLYNDLKIYKENYTWVSKILSITKKLYSNGVTSQQALLEIQVRKSELDSDIKSVKHDIDAVNEQMSYLIGNVTPNIESIPWSLLENKTQATDHLEESKKLMVDSSQANYRSSRLNLIPDVTVSFGYTKRSDIDDNGDFVSASIAIPLPFSSKKYARKGIALSQKARSEVELINYRKNKNSMEKSLESQIKKFKSELQILNEQSIKYAENSRTVTSKSYGLGDATYIELLQSEIKLQSLKLKSNLLTSKYRKTKVELKLLRGENLHE